MGYDDNRLDKRLADLLHGDHPIQGDHMQKVVEIAELIELEKAVERAGWHRHTGDWDWGAYIMTDDREYSLAWSIGFVFPDTIKPEAFTASVDYDQVQLIHVEGLTWNDDEDANDELSEDIWIDSITNIRWEEM
jgi:hypothetical protein